MAQPPQDFVVEGGPVLAFSITTPVNINFRAEDMVRVEASAFVQQMQQAVVEQAHHHQQSRSSEHLDANEPGMGTGSPLLTGSAISVLVQGCLRIDADRLERRQDTEGNARNNRDRHRETQHPGIHPYFVKTG